MPFISFMAKAYYINFDSSIILSLSQASESHIYAIFKFCIMFNLELITPQNDLASKIPTKETALYAPQQQNSKNNYVFMLIKYTSRA